MDCKSGFEEIECNKQIYWSMIRVEDWWKLSSRKLGSTDAAPEVPHPCPTQRDAGRGVRRGCPRVGPHLHFFFFSDSRRLGSIRANAARSVPNRLRFAPNRADSAKIGSYRPYRVGQNRPENGRNMPKSALNMAGKAETCLLLSFFVNQGIVCVF